MKKIRCLARLYLDETGGAVAIEYGIIAAAMGLMLLPAMNLLAPMISAQFTSIAGLFDLVTP